MTNASATEHGNVRYVSFGKGQANKMLPDEDFDTTLYWRLKAKQLERAKQFDKGLFKGCYTLMGEPLSKEAKHSILSYLNDPTLEAWLQIRSLLVADIVTLWQAWLAVDSDAPFSGSDRFPHPDVLRQAIPNAVRMREETVGRKLMDCHTI